MPQHKNICGTPEEWLARAKSNLALAKSDKPEDTFWEDLCFNAQQAAEKALKALLQYKTIPFRYTHDLEELLATLEKHGVSIPDQIKEITVLTEYAVEARYPGPFEAVTDSEYTEAVKMAEKIVGWTEKIIFRS